MNGILDDPLFLISLQAGSYAIMGLPFSLFLAARKPIVSPVGMYMTAPIWGFFLCLWVGVCSTKFGWDPGMTESILLAGASLLTLGLLVFLRDRISGFSLGVGLTGVAHSQNPDILLNKPDGSVAIDVPRPQRLFLYVADNSSIKPGKTKYQVTILLDNGHLASVPIKRN